MPPLPWIKPRSGLAFQPDPSSGGREARRMPPPSRSVLPSAAVVLVAVDVAADDHLGSATAVYAIGRLKLRPE